MKERIIGHQETPGQAESFFLKDDETALVKSSENIFWRLQELPDDFVWKTGLEKRRKGKVLRILQEYFDVLELATRKTPKAFDRFHIARRRFWLNLTEEIKKKQTYHLIPALTRNLGFYVETNPWLEPIFLVDIINLYYLLCEKDKILAGIKGGVWWKKISAENYPPKEQKFAWVSIVTQMSTIFHLIGQSELELVPDRFILVENLKKLNLPKPAKSIEDLLEEAYDNQRYIISPEGAEVHLQKAGDLESMTVKQSGTKVLAKAKTTLGEALVGVDIDLAESFSPDMYAGESEEPRLANILAEVYRDLVIAIEVPGVPRKKRKKREVKIVEEKEPREYTWIYIPRIIRIKGEEREVPPLFPYEGPPRPRREHFVRGYLRRGNMTKKQRRNLEQFHRDTGIDILRLVPEEGYTFVRPHKRGGKDEDFKRLPTFIKRRVETEYESKVKTELTRLREIDRL